MTTTRLTTSRLWILGAPDPESAAIERLLTEAGESVTHATCGGTRVHGGTAYRADTRAGATHWVECSPADGHPEGAVVIDHHRPGDPGYGRPPEEFLSASSLGQVIEHLAALAAVGACALPPGWQIRHGRTYSDATRRSPGWQRQFCQDVEHRDGCSRVTREYSIPRPEYVVDAWADTPARMWGESPDGRRPAGCAPASKEGEFRALVIPPDSWRQILLTSAADHCLGAAYRGECPGVDPDELMRWRAESRAAFQRRSVEEVLADIESAQAALEAADEETLGHIDAYGCCCCRCGVQVVADDGGPHDYCECPRVRDMRRDEPIPELPEAALRLGVGYISGPLDSPDGRRKITCSGLPLQVQAFLDSWAPAQGLADTYGDPARGFAGGYLPD